MTELLLLYLLGLVHSGFAGYREANGRNLLIDKRRYYRRAVLRGLAVGQGAATVIFCTLLALYLSASDGALLLERLGDAGRSALAIYLPYTLVVLLAFVPYLVPSLESRTLTIVVVFGPLTLLLPPVILAGAVAAVARAPRPEVATLFAVSVAAVAVVEPILSVAGWSDKEARAALE